MDSDGELDIVEQAERTALLEIDDGDEETEEVQREVNDDDVEEVEADGNDEDNTVRRVIKPKKIVRNPQPKLNADTLRGQRGLTALPALFAKQKFKGKGHEEKDLNVILKTYEYWCHRLFPKMRFDQCIEKIETLGNKKQVMTYVKRIRMGILDEEPAEPRPNVVSDDETENTPTAQQQQQIESIEARFDSFAQRQEVTIETQAELTDEQKEIIRVNREQALKLKAERLRRIQEQAEAKLCTSNVLPTSQASQSQDDSVNVSVIEQEIQDSIHDKTTQKLNTQQNNENEINVDDMLEKMQTTNVEFDSEPIKVPNEVNDNQMNEESEEMCVDDMLNNLN